MSISQSIAIIDQNITTNGNGEITGQVLNQTLKTMLTSSLSASYATTASYVIGGSSVLGTLNYSSSILTSTELATLNWSTGYQLLPTLSAGYYYDMEKIIMKYRYSSSAYTVDRPYLSIWVSDPETPWVYVSTGFLYQNSSNAVISLKQSSVQLDTSEDINYSYIPQSYNGNCELYLGNTSGGSITGGGGTLEFQMYYYIREF